MAKSKTNVAGRGRIFGGTINSLKNLGMSAGLDFHYYRTDELELPPTQVMKPFRDLLKMMGGDLVNKDGIEYYFGNIEGMRQEIENWCSQVGIYVDETTIDWEKSLTTRGTGKKEVYINMPTKYDASKPKKIADSIYNIDIPDSKEVIYDPHTKQEVTYYGADKSDVWMKYYQGKADEIFNDAIKMWKQINPPGKMDAGEWFEKLKIHYKDVIGDLFTGKKDEINPELGFPSIYGRDKAAESEISDYKEQVHKKINNKREKILQMRTYLPFTFYQHTFLVIWPYYFDEATKPYVTLESIGFAPKRGEHKLGLDEYGYPLEVADDNTEFNGQSIPKGTVLLDVFLGDLNPRRIPEAHFGFLRYVPLNQMVAHILNEWDEFRDDWRDGRHHKGSLTVTDYIMATTTALGKEWEKKGNSKLALADLDKIRSGLPYNQLMVNDDYKKYEMKIGPLNDSVGNQIFPRAGTPEVDGQPVFKGTRVPSNLNPAFDLRAFGKNDPIIHIGKLRYWEGEEGCKKEHPDPSKRADFAPWISSRGLSMFIIDFICRNGKSLKEIHEDLIMIGKETNGFDYGPRPFGGDLCVDPFNVNIGPANDSIKKGE